ncbi:MAG: hypothetical protein AB7K24_03950 [Gemmataceae bacterium]
MPKFQRTFSKPASAPGLISGTRPGDETYDKLPFHEELGVPEVWVIHRDTKLPEIHVLKRGKLRSSAPPVKAGCAARALESS